MAKSLIVYYSRTGITEKAANKLAMATGSDVNRLVYGHVSKVGFLTGIMESLMKKTKEITGDTFDPSKYETVVLMTPIWADGCATPIRCYISKYRNSIPDYSILATSNASEMNGVTAEFEKILGKTPLATQLIHAKDIKAGNFEIDQSLMGKKNKQKNKQKNK